MKLYFLPGVCSLVPHTALEWIGAPYEAEAMVPREKLKSPEFLAVNPKGSVPAITDGDFTLTQNIAILNYLDTKHPEAKIFGSNTAEGKARAFAWLSFANSDVHPSFGPLFRPNPNLDETAQALVTQAAVERIISLYAIADAQLAKQDYLGDDFSVADVYLYVTMRWAGAKGIDYSHLKNLTAFFNRIHNKAVVQKVLELEGL